MKVIRFKIENNTADNKKFEDYSTGGRLMIAGKRWAGVLIFFGVFLFLTGQAGAQSENDGKWSFSITPYSWLSKIEGRMATLPPLPSSKVDLDTGTILENLDLAFMAVAEIRKGRWGAFGDIAYSRLSTEADSPFGLLYSGINVKSSNLILSFGGSYRAVSTTSGFLDVLVGGRYWSIDTELELQGLLLPNRIQKHSEDWLDPLVGVKGRVELGRGFFLSGWGNVGGFCAASKFSYDVYGGLGYAFNKTVGATFGYRVLYVDYEHDRFEYDVTQHGPISGLSFRF